ncbi:hypothetical protein IMCC3317_25700 [Kordia antarctica]|uniref:Uncharacterized protein n=1 Tax=Kordia antarctica TaxID=1218801 RepID=A0A7L4ZKQ3_9FLAO|nr:hypothetical protein [Kordia antarctica]QHI37192.1 hypothetical protein IMCC3317_25700 [Kordia antarctica]
MKYLLYLFSIVLFAKGCGETSAETETTKSAQDDISIIYEASSRGFYQKIQLSKEEISIPKDRNANLVLRKTCSKADWNEVVQLLDKIDGEKLGETSANEEDFARDAAIPATLTIKYKDKTVTSKTFSHENPPTTLAPLVAKLQAMAKAVENQ